MRLVVDLQGAQTESRLRGIGRQSRHIARSMIERAGGHDIHIVLNARLTENLDELIQEFGAALTPRHVHVFQVPGPVREIELGNMWRMRAAELAREAFLADLEPDVVYLTSLFEGVVDDAVTSIGLMQASHATVASLFDLIPLANPSTYLATGFMQQFYYRRLQSLKRADRLVAISEFAKREAVDLLNILPARIDVALLAADAAFRKIDLTTEQGALLRERYGLPDSFIFYVGAFDGRKNIPLVIEAFGKMPSDIQARYPLVLAGKHNTEILGQLGALADHVSVKRDRLFFPGYVADADLAALYSLCSLFVFPSIHEGFGLPPLEAMACGAPVLAARNSSLPEVMGRDDMMFDTFDANDLSAKMLRILVDKDHARSARQWGVERAAQFTWQRAGAETLASIEMVDADRNRRLPTFVEFRRRPRLAFVSPLPADRSGIADYGAALLRELGVHYDIECITISDAVITDPWILANFVIRDVAYFQQFAFGYERILYQFGNSAVHEPMFQLLEEIPGVVILHDFFLSGLLDWLGNTGRRPAEDFLKELYLSHGLPALIFSKDSGRHAAAVEYPTNRAIFDHALGVVVHSHWAMKYARDLYGDEIAGRMALVPQLRATRTNLDRTAARRRLGIAEGVYLACSFGLVADTKLTDRLVDAWHRSSSGRTLGARLVLVGELVEGSWANALSQAIEECSGLVEIEITGYVDVNTYGDYLAAADVAIQLRHRSRGETSAAILDCMAAGLAVIANAHGPVAEHPQGVIEMLPDVFKTDELVAAIDTLAMDRAAREALGWRAFDQIQAAHHPALVVDRMRAAIEGFSTSGAPARQRRLLEALRDVDAPTAPSEHDIGLLATAIARNASRIGPRRFLYDVTLLAEGDAHTGIQRVVRAVLSRLASHPPQGYRVELVRIDHGRLVFARSFAAQILGVAAGSLPDAPVDYDTGDVYLALEWAADRLPDALNWLLNFRRHGGHVVIGVHDLLPLQLPSRFPPLVECIYSRWLETVLEVADQIVCVSRSVADDMLRISDILAVPAARSIAVDHFRLGADIAATLPTRGLADDAADLLAAMAARPTFLMVGTVEPRKGHAQTVVAFEQLWSRGVDVALVIVGRPGWMVEAVARRIEDSPEKGRRLFWLQGISDEYLGSLYTSAKALIAASEGEGFGLPLVEAAAENVPLIVRDLPVFREVAGDQAYYFTGYEPDGLAAHIEKWLLLADSGQAPGSSGIPQTRWAESTDQLVEAILASEHYGAIGGGSPTER